MPEPTQQPGASEDEIAVDAVAAALFDAFTNAAGRAAAVDVLYGLFLPEAVIVKRAGGACHPMTLGEFVEPRRALLHDGRLTEFREWEVSHRTSIVGGIAQRLSAYAKAGCLEGRWFEGRGEKALQLVRAGGARRIAALSWEDEV
jgi:hypothetical protein